MQNGCTPLLFVCAKVTWKSHIDRRLVRRSEGTFRSHKGMRGAGFQADSYWILLRTVSRRPAVKGVASEVECNGGILCPEGRELGDAGVKVFVLPVEGDFYSGIQWPQTTVK